MNKFSRNSLISVLYKYAMPVRVTWRNVSPREDGFPEGGARGKTILPRGDIPSCYPHCHSIFVLLYRTNPVCNCKQSKVTDDWWFTHSPLGVASGNGQHEALTDGIRQHDDCSLLSQPITAYDLKVRYNKIHMMTILWSQYFEKYKIENRKCYHVPQPASNISICVQRFVEFCLHVLCVQMFLKYSSCRFPVDVGPCT